MNITNESLAMVLDKKEAYKVFDVCKNHLLSIYPTDMVGRVIYEFDVNDAISKFRSLAQEADKEDDSVAFFRYFDYAEIMKKVREL